MDFERYETHELEFKQTFVPDIKKEVIAFANGDGGRILVGVRKDGVVVGVTDVDEMMLKIVNVIKEGIIPDVMPFVQVHVINSDEKPVIQIEVSPGTHRPYYLREKGLRSGGVYIRQGSASIPVSDVGIREMIVHQSGTSYEMNRSMMQSLTFSELTQAMRERGLSIDEIKMKNLKMIGEDGLYTNLAYLLSDQLESTTKVAVFQGKDNAVFRDRREFTGSLLKQLEDVYTFLDLMNKTSATFHGLQRVDARDYPVEAVREALLNCIVHRDYGVSADNIINIYDDRITFVSVGGLVTGLELQSIFLGLSQSRNPYLANILYRMKLIESYGTGIAKIMRLYDGCAQKPVFETAKGVFRVTLPNYHEAATSVIADVSGMYRTPQRASRHMQRKQRILDYLSTHEHITRGDVEALLEIGTTQAYKLLKELCEEGTLQTAGNGRLRVYVRTDVKREAV